MSVDDDAAASRAAYSASQPLYDALRAAVNRVEQSRRYLESAMLAVRREHVKTNSDRIQSGEAGQEAYVDATVSAWRGMTDAFTTIFEELSSLSGPQTDEGRDARSSHQLIKTLYHTTVAAKCAAQALPVLEDSIATQSDNANSTVQDRVRQEAEPNVPPSDSQEKTSYAVRPVVSRKRELATEQTDGQPSKLRRIERSPITAKTDSTRTSLSARARKHTLQWPMNTNGIKSAIQPAAHSGPEHLDPSTGDQPMVDSNAGDYTVRYEDVTAEVNERLAAKEQQREEKREGKKRKRRSTQSIANGDDTGRETATVKPFNKKKKKQRPDTIVDNELEREAEKRHRSQKAARTDKRSAIAEHITKAKKIKLNGVCS